jgi:hypothetical protein
VENVIQFRGRKIFFFEPVQQLAQRHRYDFVGSRINSAIAENGLGVQIPVHIYEVRDGSLVAPKEIVGTGQQPHAIQVWISLLYCHSSWLVRNERLSY